MKGLRFRDLQGLLRRRMMPVAHVTVRRLLLNGHPPSVIDPSLALGQRGVRGQRIDARSHAAGQRNAPGLRKERRTRNDPDLDLDTPKRKRNTRDPAAGVRTRNVVAETGVGAVEVTAMRMN